MENDNVYTLEQESWIEGEYADFYHALSQLNFAEAQSIVKGIEAKEFFLVAADMTKILAGKKLHHA